jgi:hypothetical protein
MCVSVPPPVCQPNAQSNFIFTGRGGGANPIGWGERIGTTPPHYPCECSHQSTNQLDARVHMLSRCSQLRTVLAQSLVACMPPERPRA